MYVQYWSLLNWHSLELALRLRCGSCKLIFYIIFSFFANLKNVVHSLEPGSNLCATFLKIKNTLKRCVWLRYGCIYFFNLLKTSTVRHTIINGWGQSSFDIKCSSFIRNVIDVFSQRLLKHFLDYYCNNIACRLFKKKTEAIKYGRLRARLCAHKPV